MPWEIEKRDDRWCVIKVEDGEVEGCHDTRKEAQAQLAALNIAEEETMEKVTTTRAVWSVAFINDLPDSSFFYVEAGEKDDEGKTTPRTLRHFPYKDSAGKVDLPHVRNAIARAPQAKDKNGDKLSETIVNRVQAKARAILEREQGTKQISLDEQARRVRDAWYLRFEPRSEPAAQPVSRQGWIKEVFEDRVIVEFPDGLWAYSYTIGEEGISFTEPVRVEVSYTNVEKGLLRQIADTVTKIAQAVFKSPFQDAPVLDVARLARSGFTVSKDKKTGKRRWLGVPTSAFYPDREGEGLSTKALQGAIDRIVQGEKRVILDLAHINLDGDIIHGEVPLSLGYADIVGMCGPFVVASGPEGDGPYAEKFFDWAEANPDEDMRMSILFEHDAAQKSSDGVYFDGVDIIRFTALPAEMAANPVTAFLVVDAKSAGGNAMKLDERVRPLLAEIYGEEAVTGIEAQLAQAKEAAEAAGAQVKSTEADEAETPEAETETPETEDTPPEVLTEESLREIIGEVVTEVLGEVSTQMKALSGQVEAIEQARQAEAEAAQKRTRRFAYAPAEPVRKDAGPIAAVSEAGVPMTSSLKPVT